MHAISRFSVVYILCFKFMKLIKLDLNTPEQSLAENKCCVLGLISAIKKYCSFPHMNCPGNRISGNYPLFAATWGRRDSRLITLPLVIRTFRNLDAAIVVFYPNLSDYPLPSHFSTPLFSLFFSAQRSLPFSRPKSSFSLKLFKPPPSFPYTPLGPSPSLLKDARYQKTSLRAVHSALTAACVSPV